jgi:hypothetical protein
MAGEGSAWVTILAAILGSGIFAAVINAVAGRRKLGADATKVITEAAGGVVERLENENERLSLRVTHLEQEVGDLKERDRVQRDLLLVHAGWDHLAIDQLRQQGVMIGSAPPLTIPRSAPTPPTP